MGKTLLYRLFKVGKIPPQALPDLQQEGIVLQDEGIGGAITFRNFRAPGKRYGWKRVWFSGSIVLTEVSLAAFQSGRPIMRVPWTDERLQQLTCTLKDETTLSVEFDAATFNPDWSGDMQISFNTPLAPSCLAMIEQKRAE